MHYGFIFFSIFLGSCLKPRERPTVCSVEQCQKSSEPISLEALTLKSQIQFSHLRPHLNKFCGEGCHRNSEVIDLSTFPFNAEGSSIDQVITAQKFNPQSDPAQRIIIESFIDAINTGYMPPAKQIPEKTREDLIEALSKWLESATLQ